MQNPIILFPSMGTYIYTQPTYSYLSLLLHLFEIVFTFLGIISHFPALILSKIPSCKSLNRTYFHAFVTGSTSVFHFAAGRLKRHICQYRYPSNPWSFIWRYQETALSYPAQSGQMGSQLVGELSTYLFIINPF
jgi:hypothetical protein